MKKSKFSKSQNFKKVKILKTELNFIKVQFILK